MAWRFHAIDATLSPWPRRLDGVDNYVVFYYSYHSLIKNNLRGACMRDERDNGNTLSLQKNARRLSKIKFRVVFQE